MTHPAILRAERTGYGLPLDECKLPCCPACGDRLYHDDSLYISGVSGRVVGCSHCISEKTANDYMEETA